MRLLVFSAHCADFCSRAGGTIARYTSEGAQVRVVALSNGERSESGGLFAGGARPSLDEVRAIRHEEADTAAGVLGAEMVYINWDDLKFDYTQSNVLRLAEEIRAFRPDAILTHHGPDPCSVDHDTCSRLVVRAAQVAGAPGLESAHSPAGGAAVFFFEATIPLTELEGFNPDFYIDITPVWEKKLVALHCFARAQGILAGWYTEQAKLRAFQAQRLTGRRDIVYAEAFERTSPWVGDHLPLNGR